MRTFARFCCCPLLLVISLGAPHAAAADRIGWRAAVEAGPELDTNAQRVNQPSPASSTSLTPITAPLFRLSGSAGLKARVSGHQLLALEYGGGGKLFLSEGGRDADELVQYANAGWGVSAGESALWLSGTYYDAFQRYSTRDFRTGTAGLQLAIDKLPAGLRAAVDLGYRGLGYKPLPDYSFHGLVGGLGLSWRRSSGPDHAPVDWELRAGYAAGLRFFTGNVIAEPGRCAAFPCNEDAPRRDLHHQVHVEVNYLGNASAGLGYTLEVNRSNSYGESYVRHALGLRFTAALIWKLFLTAKATLQLSRYQDPFLISQVSTVSFVSIDDENRSSLVVQLSREINERWAINLRWSLWVNESSSAGQNDSMTATAAALIDSSGFLRQTLFLGARYEYGR